MPKRYVNIRYSIRTPDKSMELTYCTIKRGTAKRQGYGEKWPGMGLESSFVTRKLVKSFQQVGRDLTHAIAKRCYLILLEVLDCWSPLLNTYSAYQNYLSTASIINCIPPESGDDLASSQVAQDLCPYPAACLTRQGEEGLLLCLYS